MTREEAIQMLKEMKSEECYNALIDLCDMAISALQDMPIHFGRCWDCVSFIAEGEKCKWDLLTGEDGYCHHFLEKYGELNCITESPNDVIEKNDEVIKSVRCKDCEWFDNCESFVTPPCTKQTEPSDFIRQETIKELGDWLEQMIQHGVPSHSAKRKALANAIALLSMDTHEIHTETHECVKETHDSDLISRADAVAYPLGFDHYDKENGSREFICGVESYREYIQNLPSVKATENKYDCDLISREKAIESAEVHCTTDGAYGYMDIKSIVDMLESLPSVSAERSGEWEYEIMVMPLSNHTKDSYRCSVCHTHWDCETNYCPNCGARMGNDDDDLDGLKIIAIIDGKGGAE